MDASARILLVEDHPETADLMVRVLELGGYDVCLAKDVREALVAADSRPFDLALCDLELPDGDGCELMRQLRELHDLQGIAVTGHTGPEVDDRVQQAHFQRHLTKPMTFDALKAAIDECLLEHVGSEGWIG